MPTEIDRQKRRRGVVIIDVPVLEQHVNRPPRRRDGIAFRFLAVLVGLRACH
ncbi:MAG: hypothetical protein JOY61_04110 [Chloroflexi bacterium]|nr:hypothetical protein [Chloroflexota bacterium]